MCRALSKPLANAKMILKGRNVEDRGVWGGYHTKQYSMGARGHFSRLSTHFRSGHDLTAREFKPHIGLSAISAELDSDPLSPSLSDPLPPNINIKEKKLEKNTQKKYSMEPAGWGRNTKAPQKAECEMVCLGGLQKLKAKSWKMAVFGQEKTCDVVTLAFSISWRSWITYQRPFYYLMW